MSQKHCKKKCCGSQETTKWSRVAGLGFSSLLLLLFLFFSLFFTPYERFNCPGWGRRFRSLCLDPFHFLRSSHSSFLLGSVLSVNVRQPRSGWILLLLSNPSRQHSKVLYRWGVSRRGKTGNHRKVGVKRK